LAILTGVLLATAFPRFHFHFLAWIALVPLMVQSLHSGPRIALRQWLLAGWVFHSLVLQWLAANEFWAGGWAVIGYQLLVLALTVFWGALGMLWVHACNRRSPVGGALFCAFLWGGMEWCHANLFTGFGWCNLAYSQGTNLYFLQWAALGGAALLAFWIVLINALIALSFVYAQWRWHRLATAGVLLLLLHGAGYLLLQEADYKSKPWRVGLYQSNYSQEFKWDREFYQPQLDLAAYYCKQLNTYEVEKVEGFVWPEGLIMDHYDQPEYMASMQSLCLETGAWLFTGTGREENGSHYNSSIVMDAEGKVSDYYDKVHLVPFGEYIPYEEYLPFLKQIVPGGGAAKGGEQKVLKAGERTLGPLICFEVLYPGMSQKLREMGADVLVVVTNLAWFGRSNAIVEELEFGRLRAVENRLPLIHSSNTGISGVFDPFGRFTPINAYLSRGRYVTLEDQHLSFEQMTQQRMLGALPVPAPGALPWSGGPASVPVLLLFAAIIGIGLLFLLSPMRENGGSNDGGGEPENGGEPLQEVSAEEASGKPLRGVRIDGDY